MEEDIEIIIQVLQSTNLTDVEKNTDYRWLSTQIVKELAFNKIKN